MAQAAVKEGIGNRRGFWRRHLLRWHRSGLPVRAYCARAGLSAWSFYAWRRRLAKEDREAAERISPSPGVAPGGDAVGAGAPSQRADRTAVAFVEVAAGDVLQEVTKADGRPEAGSPAAGYVEVQVSGGRGIRVWPGFDGETLRRVLAVLEGGRC
jgi:hypothetical protein